VTVNDVLSLKNEVHQVALLTGGTAHVIGTVGKRINRFTHTAAASATLPTDPTEGTTYSFINDLDATFTLTLNRGGTNTIDDASATSLALDAKYQRVTLTFANGIWYII
jgi:hypothetical protein